MTATITPLASAPPKGAPLTLRCPDHGEIATGRPAPLQTETGWKFQHQARHQQQTGCRHECDLGQAAA